MKDYKTYVSNLLEQDHKDFSRTGRLYDRMGSPEMIDEYLRGDFDMSCLESSPSRLYYEGVPVSSCMYLHLSLAGMV